MEHNVHFPRARAAAAIMGQQDTSVAPVRFYRGVSEPDVRPSARVGGTKGPMGPIRASGFWAGKPQGDHANYRRSCAALRRDGSAPDQFGRGSRWAGVTL